MEDIIEEVILAGQSMKGVEHLKSFKEEVTFNLNNTKSPSNKHTKLTLMGQKAKGINDIQIHEKESNLNKWVVAHTKEV